MGEKYKVSELAGLLGITPKTAYKVIEREQLITSKDIVNGREVTHIIISNEDILGLKQKYIKNNVGKDTVNVGHYEDILTDNEYTVSRENIAVPIQILQEMQQYTITVNNQHREELREYIDRVINAEKQVKLLEDSETRKENEYLAKIKQLESENIHLKEQLAKANRPWWKKAKQ